MVVRQARAASLETVEEPPQAVLAAGRQGVMTLQRAAGAEAVRQAPRHRTPEHRALERDLGLRDRAAAMTTGMQTARAATHPQAELAEQVQATEVETATGLARQEILPPTETVAISLRLEAVRRRRILEVEVRRRAAVPLPPEVGPDLVARHPHLTKVARAIPVLLRVEMERQSIYRLRQLSMALARFRQRQRFLSRQRSGFSAPV